MFVVHDGTNIVFLRNDPTQQGCREPVKSNVTLTRCHDPQRDFPFGTRGAESLGVNPHNDREYQTFKSGEELTASGYIAISQMSLMAGPFSDWAEYQDWLKHV